MKDEVIKNNENGRFIDARTLPLRESTAYIVFDLEWNQCPYGKSREVADLPFEIIDIGAVKLARDGSLIDTFHCFVRPAVYKRLHYRTRQVIGLSESELAGGIPFPEAARAFLSFCGEDYLLCTWGDQDIFELERNLSFYRMNGLLPGPLFFGDVQKFFSIAYENRAKRRSLESAASFLHIPETRTYHRAYDDAAYTAEILRKIPEEVIVRHFSVDTYQHPSDRRSQLRLRLTGCEKYISCEFPSRIAAFRDREVTATRCIVCGKNAARIVPFTSHGRKQYLALSRCRSHGLLYSRIRVKSSDPDSPSCFIEKVTRCISPEEALHYFRIPPEKLQ